MHIFVLKCTAGLLFHSRNINAGNHHNYLWWLSAFSQFMIQILSTLLWHHFRSSHGHSANTVKRAGKQRQVPCVRRAKLHSWYVLPINWLHLLYLVLVNLSIAVCEINFQTIVDLFQTTSLSVLFFWWDRPELCQHLTFAEYWNFAGIFPLQPLRIGMWISIQHTS